MFPDFATNNT